MKSIIVLLLSVVCGLAQNPLLVVPLAGTTSSFTDPTDEPALAAWYDVDTLPSAGTAISEWTDSSGFSRTITNITSARPVSTNGPNSKLLAHFDGTDDNLKWGTIGGGLSLFQNKSNVVLFALARAGATTTGKRLFTFQTAGSVTRAAATTTASSEAGGRRLDTDSAQLIGPADTSFITNFIIWEIHFKYGDSDLYFYTNGVEAASTTSYQTSGSTSNTLSSAASLGSDTAGASYWSGTIGDVIIITNSISASRALEFRTWYTNKFAL